MTHNIRNAMQFSVILFLISSAVCDDGAPPVASTAVQPAENAMVQPEQSSDKNFLHSFFVSAPRELKEQLDHKGISANVKLTNDWSDNFRGGAEPGGTAERYLLDVSASLNTSKISGWKGGTAFMRLQNHVGANGSSRVGDAQGFSNIDALPRTALYELWFQQTLLTEDKLRIKVGTVDANTEFATVEHGGDFLNSAMGYSPTILKLPTYPQPRPSINVFFRANSHYSVGVGAYDTAGAGGMPIAEVGRRWQVGSSQLDSRAVAGFWWQTARLRCFDGDSVPGTRGFYAVYEQALWKKHTASGANAPARDVFAFFQYGHANGEVSNFTHHVGGGLAWRGPFARRAKDSLGGGATWVRLTDQNEAGFDESSEVAVETFYKFQLTSYFSVSPDMQFIHNPGGLHAQRDAVVFTPRITLSF